MQEILNVFETLTIRKIFENIKNFQNIINSTSFPKYKRSENFPQFQRFYKLITPKILKFLKLKQICCYKIKKLKACDKISKI
jgi:hypothetical protein